MPSINKQKKFRYTTSIDWDIYYKNHKLKNINKVIFDDIFQKFLTIDSQKTVLEIGCAGGEFLCYLAKKFNYKAFGIDYSNKIKKTKELFVFNNLQEPVLYKQDFFQWNPNRTFDIVCSFGFVEHFKDLDYVVKKHANLVSPGGIIIITMPHFAHAQYLFHRLIDQDNLLKHNTKIMNLKSVRRAFHHLPFTIQHLSYYRTFSFWTEQKHLVWWEKIINHSIQKFGKIINTVFGCNWPNPLFSPHIVCVAKKHK